MAIHAVVWAPPRIAEPACPLLTSLFRRTVHFLLIRLLRRIPRIRQIRRLLLILGDDDPAAMRQRGHRKAGSTKNTAVDAISRLIPGGRKRGASDPIPSRPKVEQPAAL